MRALQVCPTSRVTHDPLIGVSSTNCGLESTNSTVSTATTKIFIHALNGSLKRVNMARLFQETSCQSTREQLAHQIGKVHIYRACSVRIVCNCSKNVNKCMQMLDQPTQTTMGVTHHVTRHHTEQQLYNCCKLQPIIVKASYLHMQFKFFCVQKLGVTVLSQDQSPSVTNFMG